MAMTVSRVDIKKIPIGLRREGSRYYCIVGDMHDAPNSYLEHIIEHDKAINRRTRLFVSIVGLFAVVALIASVI